MSPHLITSHLQPNDGLTTTLLDINLRNSVEATPLSLALARGFTHLAEQMIQVTARSSPLSPPEAPLPWLLSLLLT